MPLTPHHAKYYAHDLTRRAARGMDRLSTALFDAAVDLNPRQIAAERQAVTLAEQHAIPARIQKLERQQRKQRLEIFAAEDAVLEKRDRLIDELERRLAQQTESTALFSIRWTVG